MGQIRLPIIADLNVRDQKIVNVGTPTVDTDAANKAYVDAAGGGFPPFSATQDYAMGDQVIENLKLYVAKAAITAGAFDATEWNEISAGISSINYSDVVNHPIERYDYTTTIALDGMRTNQVSGQISETMRLSLNNSLIVPTATAAVPVSVTTAGTDTTSTSLTQMSFLNFFGWSSNATIVAVVPTDISPITYTQATFVEDVFGALDGMTLSGITFGYDAATSTGTLTGIQALNNAPIIFVQGATNASRQVNATTLGTAGNPGAVFTIDPDTDNRITPNTATGTLNGGETIAQNLQQMATAVAALSPNFTTNGTVTAGTTHSTIDIDMGTDSGVLNSSVTLTQTSAGDFTVQNLDIDNREGTVATTITLTDPFGAELTSFTSSVTATTESNIAAIAGQLTGLINSNTEMPVDFSAVYNATNHTIAVTSDGTSRTITGNWALSIDHGASVAPHLGDLTGNVTPLVRNTVNEIDAIRVTGDTYLTNVTGTGDVIGLDSNNKVVKVNSSHIPSSLFFPVNATIGDYYWLQAASGSFLPGLYRYVGGMVPSQAWQRAYDIPDGAVTSAKLGVGSVGAVALGTGAVINSKYANNSISPEKLIAATDDDRRDFQERIDADLLEDFTIQRDYRIGAKAIRNDGLYRAKVAVGKNRGVGATLTVLANTTYPIASLPMDWDYILSTGAVSLNSITLTNIASDEDFIDKLFAAIGGGLTAQGGVFSAGPDLSYTFTRLNNSSFTIVSSRRQVITDQENDTEGDQIVINTGSNTVGFTASNLLDKTTTENIGGNVQLITPNTVFVASEWEIIGAIPDNSITAPKLDLPAENGYYVPAVIGAYTGTPAALPAGLIVADSEVTLVYGQLGIEVRRGVLTSGSEATELLGMFPIGSTVTIGSRTAIVSGAPRFVGGTTNIITGNTGLVDDVFLPVNHLVGWTPFQRVNLTQNSDITVGMTTGTEIYDGQIIPHLQADIRTIQDNDNDPNDWLAFLASAKPTPSTGTLTISGTATTWQARTWRGATWYWFRTVGPNNLGQFWSDINNDANTRKINIG